MRWPLLTTQAINTLRKHMRVLLNVRTVISNWPSKHSVQPLNARFRQSLLSSASFSILSYYVAADSGLRSEELTRCTVECFICQVHVLTISQLIHHFEKHHANRSLEPFRVFKSDDDGCSNALYYIRLCKSTVYRTHTRSIHSASYQSSIFTFRVSDRPKASKLLEYGPRSAEYHLILPKQMVDDPSRNSQPTPSDDNGTQCENC